MEGGFSQIQSHTIAITANGRLNHSTYFTIASNGSAINPGHFGPIQGNSIVFLVLNLICRSRDMHRLFVDLLWSTKWLISTNNHNSTLTVKHSVGSWWYLSLAVTLILFLYFHCSLYRFCMSQWIRLPSMQWNWNRILQIFMFNQQWRMPWVYNMYRNISYVSSWSMLLTWNSLSKCVQ